MGDPIRDHLKVKRRAGRPNEMPHVGVTELLIILLIVLIIFGAGKLPSISRGIARSIREFRQATVEEPPGTKIGHGDEPGRS